MAAICKEHGIEFDAYFLPPEPSEEDWGALRQRLDSKQWKVVSIGSGFRLSDKHTTLLEDVVNTTLATVHPMPKVEGMIIKTANIIRKWGEYSSQ
ncbi:hypothetical protein NW762_013921 [Fusarium torreyae]|uniref:Uncharacterized protein n=1 Tax=Fusarium torreyae TaxID=1237075 RepID=A0A9W8V9Y0_9HYPO|nr:hypothetical protein NW762_013921 [Fusarium torreyae]